MKYALAALALTLAASGAIAAGDSLTEADSAALRLAIDRGQLLYAYDQAAWHATDDMTAQAKRAATYDQLMRTGGGYVVEGDAKEQTVTFYDRTTPPNALYRARMTNGGTRLNSSEFLAKPEPLSEAQQRLVRERQAVIDAARVQNVSMCAQANPNIAILPAQRSNGSDLGYFMTPQTDIMSWPVGGHYRFELTEGQAGSAQPFTKTCLTIGQQPGEKGQPAMMFVTNLLSPTPNEIHVFTALAAKIPLVVATFPAKKYWLVMPAPSVSIRLVDIGAKH